MLRQALRRVASSASSSTSTSSSSTSSPAALLLFRPSSSSAAAAVKEAGSSKPPPPPPRQRARWLLFLPPAAAAFLCHWQLERRDWKVKLLEERAVALQREPLRLEEVLSALRDRDRNVGGEEGAKRPMREMTRVVVGNDGSGGSSSNSNSFSFDRSSTLLVGPRPRSFGGSTVGGSLVVTPLRRRRRKGKGEGEGEEEEEGALVVRGWVPSGWRPEDDDVEDERKKKKRRQRPSSPSLLCVLRDSESPSRFVPDNDPARSLWHWIDAAEMAAAVGLPREGTPLLEVVAGNADDGESAPFGDDDFGLRDGEEDQKKRRPSLMEVLGGRTAERGSGSPLVGSSSSASSTSSTVAPSSSSSPPRPPLQPRPQPRSLEEISQVPVSPGQHLQYAATWGTLALATAALAVKVGRRGGRRGGRGGG